MTRTPPTTSSRKRQARLALSPLRVLLGVVVAGVILSACGNRTTIDVGSAAEAAPSSSSSSSSLAEGFPAVIDEAPASTAEGTGENNENETPTTLADLTTPLGSAQVDLNRLAADVEREASSAQPQSISIPTLGVENASVAAVGVEPNGDMEIPAADEVGWYRFGPRPGEPGSAVIAGHIAYNGIDGVFRYLADLDEGTTFSLSFTDGTVAEYLVTDLQTYLKTELPTDELFDQTGPARLVLITCGGSFNYDASSYESNVVAYAVPL